jgi:hypothetical protein
VAQGDDVVAAHDQRRCVGCGRRNRHARSGREIGLGSLAFEGQQHREAIVKDASSIGVRCRPAHAVVRPGYACSPTMRS